MPPPTLRSQDINVPSKATQRRQRKGSVNQVAAVDYASLSGRPPMPNHISSIYHREALRQLSEDFPTLREQDLQTLLYQKQCFYAPAFITCYDCVTRNAPVPLRQAGFVRVNVTTRTVPKYGDKRRVLCEEFEAERVWTQDWKARYDAKRTQKRKRTSDVNELHAMRQELAQEWADAQLPEYLQHSTSDTLPGTMAANAPEDSDNADIVPDVSVRIECGCCNDDSTSFMDMMQCPDGHLFCKDCVRMQAETVIGNRRTEILCMDQSNCRLQFTADILHQCLDERTIALWEKIKQAKEIREANIQGLEDCPFCDYAIINTFTPEQVPLFHCAKCKKVSCRRCKKQDHTGRPCHDQIEEARLKAEHAIAEAMTLLRTCPRCKAPFIKEFGCNKMKCHSCNTYSCYVCRKQILDPYPYHHFNGQGANVPGKCPLYDGDGSADPKQRHEAEVAAAEKAARDALRAAQAGPSRNIHIAYQ